MTVTDYPVVDIGAIFGYGKVRGRALRIIGDTAADANKFPEGRGAAGTFTFTPIDTVDRVTDDGTGWGAFISQEPVPAYLDQYGYVIDKNGADGCWLVAGKYRATFEATSGKFAIAPFEFTVTTAHTEVAPLDLTKTNPPLPPATVSLVSYVINNPGVVGDVLTRIGAGSAEWRPMPGALDVTLNNALYPRYTGETDDSPRIQRAVDDMLASNSKAVGVLRLPAGVYDLAAGVTGKVGGQQRIAVVAAVADSTLLRVLPGNTVGGIVFDTGWNPAGTKRNPTRDSQVAFQGLSVARVIGSAGQGNGTGTGLGFISGIAPNTASGGQSNSHINAAVFDRCRVWGENTDLGTFEYAFAAPGTFMPRWFGCIVGGPFTNTPTGQPDNHPSYVGKAGILMHNAYSPTISHTQVWCYEIGILDEGYIAEAGTVVMCNIVGCKIGIKHTRVANEPTFVVSDTHINARKHALWIDGIRLLQMHDCLFYNNDSTNVDPTPWDIYVLSGDIINIHDCIHYQPQGANNRIHVRLDKTNTIVGLTQIPDKDGNLYYPNAQLSNVVLARNFYSSGGLWAVYAVGVTNIDLNRNKVTATYTGSASGPYNINGSVIAQPNNTGVVVT